MRSLRVLIVGIGVCALLAACARSVPSEQAAIAGEPPLVTPLVAVTPTAWQARGTVVSAHDFADVDATVSDRAAKAVVATYRSVNATTGQSSEVTGSFFVPRGRPPQGGWPVVSFAHGTTGLLNGCGPSGHGDLLGWTGTVQALLAMRYAVAFTDYEGLGPRGVHPYLEPTTAAYNVIDAVRALRSIDASVSSRWLAYGVSQGGQAAWAADELDRDYGQDLDLVGSVALAPVADASRIADLAASQSLSSEMQAVFPMVVVGANRVDPALKLSNYLSSSVRDKLDPLIGCDNTARKEALAGLGSTDMVPASQAATVALRNHLRAIALPQRELGAPLLVVNGLADQTVLASWVSSAVSRSCRLGGRITHYELPGVGHADTVANGDVVTWIDQRFAGAPAPSNCRSE